MSEGLKTTVALHCTKKRGCILLYKKRKAASCCTKKNQGREEMKGERIKGIEVEMK